jgi:uncharacterized repeat protein (TIGR01451 family)
MTTCHRTAALLLGCWAFAVLFLTVGVRAEPRSPLARLAELAPATEEPPLAGAPAPHDWTGPPPRLAVGPPQPFADPPTPVVAIKVRVLACAAPRQELEYRITVHNLSPAPAHHVLVRNPLPANARFVRASPEPHARAPELQWKLGTLEPGKCREIVLLLAPEGGEDVKSCARVQFEHGQCVTTRLARAAPVPGVEPEPVKPVPIKPVPVPPPGQAKLALKMDGPKQQYANLPAKYQITVSNPGTAPATNVLLSNPLPAGTKLVSAGQGGRFHANQLAWLLGTIKPGGSRTVDIVLRAEKAGEICNRAGAIADDNLQAEAEVCTLFRGASALLLEMTDTRDPVAVGGETSYKIQVVNQGSVPTTGIRIKAVVPPELTVLRATGASDPPEKLPEPTKEGTELLFAPLPALAPGAEATYEVFVRARRAGDVRFRAELTADQLQKGGPVNEQEATRIVPADQE